MNVQRASRFSFGLLMIVCAVFTATVTTAAEYPIRPIRFVVPFAAGGGPDVTARLLATELSQRMGQQFVIDNRAGAGGSIGTEMIVRAAPDGYTIGYGSISTLAINRSLIAKLPYDSDKDLLKLMQTYSAPNMLAATLSLPVKTVKELIDYAKSNPGKLTFGSNGNATSPHLSGELFKFMTGTQLVHVPYKAGQQVVTDMIGGQLDLTFNNVGLILPHVKAGRLRGLGVTSSEAPAGQTGIADHRRVGRARLRSHRVGGHGGPARRAAGHRQPAQRRNQQGACLAGATGEICGARLRCGRRHVRAV